MSGVRVSLGERLGFARGASLGNPAQLIQRDFLRHDQTLPPPPAEGLAGAKLDGLVVDDSALSSCDMFGALVLREDQPRSGRSSHALCPVATTRGTQTPRNNHAEPWQRLGEWRGIRVFPGSLRRFRVGRCERKIEGWEGMLPPVSATHRDSSDAAAMQQSAAETFYFELEAFLDNWRHHGIPEHLVRAALERASRASIALENVGKLLKARG